MDGDAGTKAGAPIHRLAADQNGKGEHAKGREESSKAQAHTKTACDDAGRAGIDAPFLWLLLAVNLFSLFSSHLS
jgi:hypothetical protein